MENTEHNDWNTILEKFKSSGLSAREFARLNDLSLHSLYYRLRKSRPKKSTADKTPGFIEIPVSHSNSGSARPEITMSLENEIFTIQIRFGS